MSANLRGARFVESDLSGVVMRGVEVAGADIDAPWLIYGESLRVNGVDTAPSSRPSPTDVSRVAPNGVRRTPADRVTMVRDFISAVTPVLLAVVRRNPWAPGHQETTLSCLHVILEEEWEHHRSAVRDLDTIAAQPKA